VKRRSILKLTLAPVSSYVSASLGFQWLSLREARSADPVIEENISHELIPGEWYIFNDGVQKRPDVDGIYRDFDFSKPIDLYFNVSEAHGVANEQGAFVFNSVRLSRNSVGSASENVFVNNNDSKDGTITPVRRVKWSDYLRLQSGAEIPRESDLLLRHRYHLPLVTQEGDINTIDYFDTFFFPDVPNEDPRRVVRASTILRFAFKDANYLLNFSSGRYFEAPKSVFMSIMPINIIAPSLTFDMRQK
jgi:hypothetical protein